MNSTFINNEPIRDLELNAAKLMEQLKNILGEGFCFEERTYPTTAEVVQTIKLDVLALDRQTAALKAVSEGKNTKTAASSDNTNPSHPIYTPSQSEKLSTDEYNALIMKTFPEYETMKPGNRSKENTKFVAWDLVKRYPINYIGKTNRPKCMPFFKNMTEDCTWDFFYVYHPKALDQSPFIFVPTEQFDHFLDIVNASVQTKLTIPPGKPSEKFYLVFGSTCAIRPKYIGRSSSHNEYKTLQNTIPPPTDEDACRNISVDNMESLLNNLSAYTEGDVAKSKNKKRKQEKIQNRDESVYDAQLFLGLRPLASVTEDKDRKVVLDQPVPHALHQDVIFMSIDIEVAEEHHGTILEVGMTTLDTRDIIGIAPGEAGRKWFPHIKSRHLITEEYKDMRNNKYIKGCPELFDFGESEYPRVTELRETILAAFNELSNAGITKKEKNFRNIVLVGHDINSDLNYLAGMDIHCWTVGDMIRCLDTKDMHQSWRKGDQGRNLGLVLQDLNIAWQNLHNAGNDAAYTLRALLGLAVRAKMDEQAKTDNKMLAS